MLKRHAKNGWRASFCVAVPGSKLNAVRLVLSAPSRRPLADCYVGETEIWCRWLQQAAERFRTAEQELASPGAGQLV